MKLNELVRSMNVWTSQEEKDLLAKINNVSILNSFDEHDRYIIENLVRKSLLVKIESKNITYIYPNV